MGCLHCCLVWELDVDPVVGGLDVGERNGGVDEVVLRLLWGFKEITRCACVGDDIVMLGGDGVWR